MEQRTIERLGRTVSCVGFGAWQLGADWGDVSEADGTAALETALAEGVTFVDTADVYGDGRSERIIGRVIAGLGDARPFVATKMGRRVAQLHENYTPANFRAWIDRSRENLGLATLDLVQLHCPPSSVIADDALFDDLDSLVDERRIAAYGVSVETCDQALAAIARPGVATVQIILNAFRLKPLEQVLPAAAEAGVGIIARVPLASGLLSGRYTNATTSAPTITARTTVTASRSTWARPSRASTTRRASRRCAGSRLTCPRASRWRSGRCASCSTSPACPS